MEGYRCNNRHPEQDEYGRFVDSLPGRDEIGILPRCADVHPAVWHLAAINLTGLQGRSFVIEVDADARVNNHPFSGYTYQYFNPQSGRDKDLAQAMVPVEKYRNDPYLGARHPSTRYIVGVEMKIRYVDWISPDDKADGDHVKKKSYIYDLELDADGTVVGGQWRVNRVVDYVSDSAREDTGQPDFFWTLTKDHKKHFQGIATLPVWDVASGTQAPTSWREAAVGAHSYLYQQTAEFGWKQDCPVINGRSVLRVPCEFKTPRPQPLLNVVNQLMQLSRY